MKKYLSKIYYSRFFWISFCICLATGTTWFQQLYIFQVEVQAKFFVLPVLVGVGIGLVLQHAVLLQKLFRNQVELLTTKDKEIESSRDNLQFALNAGHAASWIFDFKTNEIRIGDLSFEFPKNCQHCSFEGFMNLVLDEFREGFQSLLLETSSKKNFELDFQMKEFPDAWYRIHARKLEAESYWLGILMDVSRQKSLEEQLKQEIKIAQEALAVKSEFLAMMSHEIRTPLNGVIGFAQLLEDYEMEDEAKEQLRHIIRCSDTLLSVINNVLNYSKIEAGKFSAKIETMNLCELLDEQAILFSAQCFAKNLDFHYLNLGPQFIKSDVACLRQVLLNLIGNALKFTSKGFVALNCFYQGEDLVIRVEDTGPGINHQDLPKLFKPFEQLENFYTRESEGTGLGLAICEHLSKLLGFRIEVSSDGVSGSCFDLIIPQEKWSGNSKLIWFHEIGLVERLGLVASYVEDEKILDLLSAMFAFSELKDSSVAFVDQLGFVRNRSAILDWIDQDSRHRLYYFSDSKIEELESIQRAIQLKRPYLTETLARVIFEEKDLRAETAKVSVDEDSQKPLILVVDDVDTNLMIARALLKKHGFDSVVAMSGSECLRLCSEQSFDGILLDCQMPDMDGFTTAQKIREIGGIYKEIPIVAYTAHVREEEHRRCLESGMQGIIHKPIKDDELISNFGKYFERSKA